MGVGGERKILCGDEEKKRKNLILIFLKMIVLFCFVLLFVVERK